MEDERKRLVWAAVYGASFTLARTSGHSTEEASSFARAEAELAVEVLETSMLEAEP